MTVPGRLHLGLVLPGLGSGGAERATFALAAALLERGHRVDLLLLRCMGEYRSAIPDGLRLYYPRRPDSDHDIPRSCCARGIEARSLPVNPLAAMRLWLALRRAYPALGVRLGNALDASVIARYVREARPPVLLSAVPRADAAVLYGRVAGALAVPAVVAVHNNVRMGYAPMRRVRALYPRADALVAVSRGVADELEGELGLAAGRVRVIPNPVPLAEIERLSHAEAPHPWFREGEPPVVLAPMRESPQKDPGTLIEAFARVRGGRPVRLAIMGAFSKPYRAELLALAARAGVAEDVVPLGFDENPWPCMRRAAVVALSSRYEGLPMTLIEAMACGTSVVSTDSPHGPREILEDGRWGALVPVGDAAALARALEETLDGKRSPAEALARRAADFSPERATDAYEDLFRAVIADAPRAGRENGARCTLRRNSPLVREGLRDGGVRRAARRGRRRRGG